MGHAFGGATWAFTRNPLRGMAVLLAANPKPAVSSAEYAWRQGDLVARKEDILFQMKDHYLNCPEREQSYLTMYRVYSVMKKRRLAAFQKMKGKFGARQPHCWRKVGMIGKRKLCNERSKQEER